MSDQRVVFMGTPPFAVATLEALVNAGIEVAAVVTAPDRPAGRGQQLRMSAVKEFALGHPALKDRILQPEKLRSPEFLAQLDAADAPLYVVVAFRMLPEVVWNRPALGTINLHASLLPAYRGAAPINWAIINGETFTGVTTFFIRQAIDTGAVIHQERVAIDPEDNAGSLHDKLMRVGAPLVVRTVQDIFAGKASVKEQSAMSGAELPHAPKLSPENCRIDPSRSTHAVHNLIRGLSPYPGAYGMWTETGRAPQHFKVTVSRLHDEKVAGAIGQISIDGDRLLLQCADGRIELLEVQAEGKKRMEAQAFARGLRSTNDILLT
jgi:methionyl-tRNA formyltransferase